MSVGDPDSNGYQYLRDSRNFKNSPELHVSASDDDDDDNNNNDEEPEVKIDSLKKMNKDEPPLNPDESKSDSKSRDSDVLDSRANYKISTNEKIQQDDVIGVPSFDSAAAAPMPEIAHAKALEPVYFHDSPSALRQEQLETWIEKQSAESSSLAKVYFLGEWWTMS